MNAILWTLMSSFVRQGLMAAGVWLATQGFITDGGTTWKEIVGILMGIASSFLSGKNAIDKGQLEKLIADILTELKFSHTSVAAGPVAVATSAGKAPDVVKKNFQ